MFAYDDAILDEFPTIRAGVIHVTELDNGPSTPELISEFEAQQASTLQSIGDTPLSELASLAAWRRAFTAFGVKPTQYRSAAEALLRRLTKQGDIPSINMAVDIGNLISIRYGLPVALFDQSPVQGSTTVRFAGGDELFTNLGSDEAVNPEPGEVIFVDDAGIVSARRWCWRQSAQSATTPATAEVLVTVEGHHEEAAADVLHATEDLATLLAEYQPQATLTSAQLSPEAPVFP